MKNKLYYIVSLLILSITLLSCTSEDNRANYCDEETSFLSENIKACNDNTTVIFMVNNPKMCNTYVNNGRGTSKESHNLCTENIEAMSCDELLMIETELDIKNIDGCLDFPKRDKRSACATNHATYCRMIYKDCGYDNLPVYCYNNGELEVDHENDKVTVLDLDGVKVVDYCSETINGYSSVSEDDSFCYSKVNVDCNNIQELDFRNDSWKTVCEE